MLVHLSKGIKLVSCPNTLIASLKHSQVLTSFQGFVCRFYPTQMVSTEKVPVDIYTEQIHCVVMAQQNTAPFPTPVILFSLDIDDF